MEILAYILNVGAILLFGWISWALLQMVLASWGHRKAKEKWVAMVNTPFGQLIGIKWVSAIAFIGSSLQVILLLLVLLASLILGKPVVIHNP